MRGLNVYDEAKQQGRLWTPAMWRDSTKIVGWWDFSDGRGITIATGLSNLIDLSGKGNHVGNLTAAAQPAWSPTGWSTGDKGAVLPDGSNDLLVLTNTINYATGAISSAAIAFNSGTGTRAVFSHAAASGAPLMRFSGTQLELVKNFIVGLLLTPAGSCPAGVRIIGCDFASSSTAWIDGVSYSVATNGNFANPIAHLFIDNSSSTPFGGGPFGELLIGTSLWNAHDRELVDGYLAWKWSKPDNLLPSHLFRNRPPLLGD
jgi:hypothetical protein